MTEDDKRTFAELVGTLFETFNRPEPSRRVLEAWWAALEDYPISVIQHAGREYLRDGKYPPKPSDIREVIEAAKRDCWPSGNEAWAMVQRADDEAETVVWTEEAKQAYFRAAKPLIDEGDRIGARMAFLDAYEKQVSAAIQANRPPTVEISEGHDPTLRRPAIEQALNHGLLTHQEAEHRLIGCDREVTGDGKALAGLLTSDAGGAEPSPRAREWIEHIRANIKQPEKPRLEESIRRRQDEVQVFASSKKSVAEQLRESSSGGDPGGES